MSLASRRRARERNARADGGSGRRVRREARRRQRGAGLLCRARHPVARPQLPVDASLTAESDLRYQTVELAGLMEDIEQAQTRVNIVVLDACRNNPFERRLRGSSRRLAAVDAARGSLIAYATAPGSVAADGDGAHAPYTDELVKALAVPNLKAEEVFKRVTAAVEDRTKGTQTPWISSSLRGDFIFNLNVTVAPAVAAPGAAGVDRETVLWQSVERSNRPEEYELFLSQFPNGVYAPFARSRIDALNKAPPIVNNPDTFKAPAASGSKWSGHIHCVQSQGAIEAKSKATAIVREASLQIRFDQQIADATYTLDERAFQGTLHFTTNIPRWELGSGFSYAKIKGRVSFDQVVIEP